MIATKHMPFFNRPILLCFLFLTGCVGGTLGNTTDLEEYPLRAASEKEGKSLKRCLKAAHATQTAARKKNGKYHKKISELPIDNECSGFIMGMKMLEHGYEIMAQFHEGESTVRWSVNEQGVIEEHLDTDMNEDVGFE